MINVGHLVVHSQQSLAKLQYTHSLLTTFGPCISDRTLVASLGNVVSTSLLQYSSTLRWLEDRAGRNGCIPSIRPLQNQRQIHGQCFCWSLGLLDGPFQLCIHIWKHGESMAMNEWFYNEWVPKKYIALRDTRLHNIQNPSLGKILRHLCLSFCVV